MREFNHPTVCLGDRWGECVKAPLGYTTWPLDGLVAEIIAGPAGLTEFAQGIAVLLASYAADGLDQVPADTLIEDNPGLYGAITTALHELADYGYIDLVGGDAG
jgi:hypothetical protein